MPRELDGIPICGDDPDDLLDRLRGRKKFAPGVHYVKQADAWMREAADEIERLRSRLAAAERVAECVKDLCWKATPFGHDDAGFIAMYVLPAGTLHRLAGAAQGAGIAAHLRAEGDQVDGTAVSGGEDSRG